MEERSFFRQIKVTVTILIAENSWALQNGTPRLAVNRSRVRDVLLQGRTEPHCL